jgi:demethylmenaquinone methyltransferase/2-methoxy-6-polyprenyl-1,4-benzoquinol methylase
VPPLPVLPDYFHDEASRQHRVKSLFDSTAGHYDWITNVMSFGSGRWYRRDALLRNGLTRGMQHLDVGAGTGVVALAGRDIVGPEGLALALDPSLPMLAVARDSGITTLVAARGESLPCSGGTFDFLSMGYALRHVRDLVTTFREYSRVLKPGGRVLLLEITRPPGRLARFALSIYMKRIVPTVALLARRSTDARTLMRFYWDTIEHCVPPETILEALREAGFVDVRRAVTLGIFSEYSARKPA